MRKRKAIREQQIMARRGIQETSQELSKINSELENKKKELDAKVHNHRRLDGNVNDLTLIVNIIMA